MIRRPVLAFTLALAACGTATTTPPPTVARIVKPIGGTVLVHPLEAAWRVADPTRGVAPALVDSDLAIEDALLAKQGFPPMATTTVAADGSFLVPAVDVTNVSLAILAVVKHPLDALFPSGYGIVRKDPAGSLKDETLTGKPVYVLSRQFITQLATAAGLAVSDLEDSGFVLGQIVDAEGKGVEGAKFARERSPSPVEVTHTDTEGLHYLDAALTTTVDGRTSASGVFLYIPPATQGATEFTAIKSGTDFEVKLSGSRAGTVVSVFISAK